MSQFSSPNHYVCIWCGVKHYHEHAAINHARRCSPEKPVYKRVWSELVSLERGKEATNPRFPNRLKALSVNDDREDI